VDAAPGPVLAAADLLPGDRDDPVRGDLPGDPFLPGALAHERRGIRGTRARRGEPAGRRRHRERLVRTLGVIATDPRIELGLCAREVVEDPPGQELGAERPMEPLDLCRWPRATQTVRAGRLNDTLRKARKGAG